PLRPRLGGGRRLRARLGDRERDVERPTDRAVAETSRQPQRRTTHPLTRKGTTMEHNHSPLTTAIPRRTVLSAAGLAGVLALAALFATRSAAQPFASHPKKNGAKPTIVLVHGAWADGSSWNEVTRRLQTTGYTVAVPPNPLRSLSGDSASLGAFLSTITG